MDGQSRRKGLLVLSQLADYMTSMRNTELQAAPNSLRLRTRDDVQRKHGGRRGHAAL